MVKNVNCIKFEYLCSTNEDELALSSELRFTAQTPQDESLLERAIFVDFKVRNAEDTFKLNCAFRVIFCFERREDMLEGQELLKKYQQEAYDEVKNIARNFLKSVRQNEEAFPDMTF